MKWVLSGLLAVVLALSITPSVFAEGTVGGKTIYVDATNGDDDTQDGTASDKAYKTVAAAVAAANSGDTIMLAAGTYTLYEKDGVATNKSLTFVGAGTKKTTWNIGTPENDTYGQSNGDFGFQGAKTLIFRNMTLKAGVMPSETVAGGRNYMGFAHTDKTIVEDCVIEGKTFYWGYTSATFKNTTFNCPNGDYAIWTYCSPVMTFNGCTFNSSGKTINVYTDYGAGKNDIIVNYKDCTVNGSTPEGKQDKAVMNINDSNMDGYKYIINISGTNVVNGVTPDNLNREYPKEQKDISCSRLFEFNTKYGPGNSGRTIVNVNEVAVWKAGKMVDHKNSDGYKDNAFTKTTGDWTTNGDGTITRTVTKECKYCGYEEKVTEYRVTYYYSNGTAKPTDSPKTGDTSNLTLWIALLLANGGAVTATTIYGRKNKRSVK